MVAQTAGGGAEAETANPLTAASSSAGPPEPAAPNPALVWVAWLALLLTPIGIYWRIVTDRTIPIGAAAADLGSIALLLGLAQVRPGLRPLRGFLLAVTAFAGGEFAIYFVQRTAAWNSWAGRNSEAHLVFAEALLETIPCALMAVTVIGSGLTRRDLFLARGDLGRPALSIRGRLISWRRLMPIATLLFAGPLALQLSVTVRPHADLFGRAVTALPEALAFAAFNAAQEEFRFRAVFLARLDPLLGAGRAMLMTSVIFGIGHWFGHPSGPSGVVLAFVAGWVLARSMVKTRGSMWAWAVHAAEDFLIYGALVMAAR
jgi:membrane protease YdiL (CAAX protease family)